MGESKLNKEGLVGRSSPCMLRPNDLFSMVLTECWMKTSTRSFVLSGAFMFFSSLWVQNYAEVQNFYIRIGLHVL
jgi:hypothetical protein